MAGLSIRGYARHRGVSHTAVRKALATGRIVADAEGAIDPVAADAQWDSSTNLSKPRNSVIGAPKQRRSPGAPPEPVGTPDVGAGEMPNGASAGETARLVSSYAGSRAAREAYLARLAKLDYERKSGKLINADEVRARQFELGRRVRDSLRGIPDRLAPILVGQTDAAVIHRLLTEELERGLSALANSLTEGGAK